MSGIAGSDRVGYRRRRRLAVESDGSEAELPRTSDRGDPLLRFFENAGREASPLSARDCPVLTVVSARSWKHWCCVLLALAAGLGILLAGYAWPQWNTGHGPGIARLFRGTFSPIIIWGSTVTLFMTAQASWIIWWARSRSLQDFGGSYRIWGWAAATWLLFSFASTTQAHVAWSQTILHHIHWKTPGAMLWCWLLPASAWGWGLALRLEQELRDNRSSHWLFLLAGTWYLAVVGILCQQQFWPQACSAELSQLLLATLQLLGQACLFLSTALHARFVLSCTAEPPLAKRRQQAKLEEQGTERRSWLGWLWPSWLFRWRAATEEDGEAKPRRGRKRATATKKKAPARKATRAVKAAPESTSEESDEGTEEEWENEDGTAAEGDDNEEAMNEEEPAGKRYRFDTAESPAGDHYSQGEEEQLKGLSKRDRRKLQQQMREQERRGGR